MDYRFRWQVFRDGLHFHQHREGQAVLDLPQIGSESRHQRSRRTRVAARWSHAAGAGEVRYVRGAVVEFEAEGRELRRHVVERCRAVPGFELISWRGGEIWRSSESCRSIDGRYQHQVTAGIRYLAAA